MLKHYTIHVYGTVQGVSFRNSAKEQATLLGIAGLARNEPDGSIYLEAEGEFESLERFLDWCREGSSYARIDRVEFTEEEPKSLNGFELY